MKKRIVERCRNKRLFGRQHTHTHALIHTHIHKHTHTHIHTHVQTHVYADTLTQKKVEKIIFFRGTSVP